MTITFHDSRAILALPSFVAGYGLYKALCFIYDKWSSPLRVLPSPHCPSLIFGNMKEIMSTETAEMQQAWVKKHGPTFTYKGFLGTTQLFTIDASAVQHVLTHSMTYPKPDMIRYRLSVIMGDGVLLAEGDQHRRQRRIMNPAFSAAQIRSMAPIFIESSLHFRDVLLAEIANAGGEARLDALSWLSKVALDIIGLAGFNYDFHALDPEAEENALIKAFSSALHTGKQGGFIPTLRLTFPSLRWLPASVDARMTEAGKTMKEIGSQILVDSKASISEEAQGKQGRKDLLSILVKANMDTHLASGRKMSDSEVTDQILTFLAAGHESTSLAITWALFALTHSPNVQTVLRAELMTVSTDTPSMDQLNGLEYLDCFIREVLRLYTPVVSAVREAITDDVLPLANPVKDARGNLIAGSIPVKKGQMIFLGFAVMNKSEEIWGSDAAEFRPERWKNVPAGAMQIPSVWGNIMSFGGGPKSCIGYRFAVAEMKALIFTLVRSFKFRLAVPFSEIGSRGIDQGAQRPFLRSDPKGVSQLPLIITAC